MDPHARGNSEHPYKSASSVFRVSRPAGLGKVAALPAQWRARQPPYNGSAEASKRPWPAHFLGTHVRTNTVNQHTEGVAHWRWQCKSLSLSDLHFEMETSLGKPRLQRGALPPPRRYAKTLGSVALLVGSWLAGTGLAAQSDLQNRVDTLVRPVIESGSAVGMVVGIIDGPRTAVFGYGRLSPDRPQTPDAHTLFEIGSVTKVFTGVLLADAVQRGEVALHDPLASFLPPGARVPQWEDRGVTLLDLATHTSGLPRLPPNLLPQVAKYPGNPYAHYTVEQMYQALAKIRLNSRPGTKYQYSNFGMGVLGHALARRAGKDYESLVVERICRPLGLNDTRIALSDAQRQRLSPGHDIDGRPLGCWDFPALPGAGALRSTASDLVRWVSANLGQISTPLQPVLDAAQLPRRDIGPAQKMALGWHVNTGQGIHWHNGQTGGYHSYLAFCRKTNTGVVVLSNTAGGIGDVLGIKLLEMLSGEKVEPPQVRMPVRLPPDKLDRYVGVYEIMPGFSITVFRQGDRLWAQATNQPRLGIYPASETRFFYRAVEAELEFVIEPNGRIEKLMVHQHGLRLPGWRGGLAGQALRKVLSALRPHPEKPVPKP